MKKEIETAVMHVSSQPGMMHGTKGVNSTETHFFLFKGAW